MTIDKKLINELYDKAVVNPRLRINYDLRNSELDLSQRMLNAMMPGTKVDIHRHPNSSESVIIICGSIDEVYYDDKGNEIDRIHLNPEYAQFGCQVPKGVWHAIEVFEPSLIFEAKDGMYGQDGTEFLSSRCAATAISEEPSMDLNAKIQSLIEMERHSGSMEVITPLYVSRMLNVPLEEVEKTMKEMGL